ncbi:putative gamma-glutamyl phosphate reductase [Cytospora mali]|uniref:glutamate-5-semialdehyde dehydrogenase n=1 Tax=Cytospora mali TaxID=578113 RepID=A0A194V3G8_CYTMA|nr:putative gamma-glutamyl phosphate reductase [Valsa mali var. pyri (nom. inval.)]
MSLTSSSPLEAAKAAKTASHFLATLPVSTRNDALTAIHDSLVASRDEILAANAKDMEAARQAAADGQLSQSLVSRLDLGKKGKWEDMLKGVLDVRGLDDPIGVVTLRTKLDDGLVLERLTCPIGVLLIIFEARPEVIANIASLAIKSGNAAILKGGKESTHSFVAISTAISAALEKCSVPNGAVQLVTTRDVIPQLLDLDQYIDLVIPRGGNDLMAAGVIVDSKTSYPAACNSLETLLVEEAALESVFPVVAEALIAKGVELRCDAKSKAVASKLGDKVQNAKDIDYDTEHLALVLAVKTVSSLNEAVEHINTHGSHHTDAILTSNNENAERFMTAVDSAGVYWNASTRMADGMRYGFGTEVGISTNKIHARGPVGLEGLTIYKYKVRGTGHVSAVYGEGEGQKSFLHEKLPL